MFQNFHYNTRSITHCHYIYKYKILFYRLSLKNSENYCEKRLRTITIKCFLFYFMCRFFTRWDLKVLWLELVLGAAEFHSSSRTWTFRTSVVEYRRVSLVQRVSLSHGFRVFRVFNYMHLFRASNTHLEKSTLFVVSLVKGGRPLERSLKKKDISQR